MKKFIGEHPVLSILLTSCLTVIVIVVATVGFTVFLGIKTAKYLSDPATYKDSNVKNEKHSYLYGNPESSAKFLAIPINGVILNEEDPTDPLSFLYQGITYGFEIKDIINEAATDDEIKGLILLVDSPGGTITGSQAIADGVKNYIQTTEKPVVALVGGLGASGAYLASTHANYIYAEPGSLTGSIGVILGPFKYYKNVTSESGPLESITAEGGIDSYYIYAGEDKDLGNPYKPLSDKAKAVLQKGVDNEYQDFVAQVRDSRKLDENTIKQDIGALLYDNKQAQELKLVDETLTRHQAYARLAQLGGVTDDKYQIVTAKPTDFWSRLFEVALDDKVNIRPTSCVLCNQMLYLHGTPDTYLK